MKGVLFLGLVGAAIYGAILLSYDALPRDPAEDAHAARTLGNPGERQLRSWGTDLPALATSSSQEASLPLPAATTASRAISSTNSQYDGTAYQPVEWAKVAFAAKVHSDASVSSPTPRFYQPGTTLQVVSRQNGWVQVVDPNSGERGWVFEQYLVPAESPIATQTAMATTSTAEPARAMPSAKKRARAPRPAARMRHDFASAQFERRWDRRGEHRGSFGLFFFGRFARAE
jgi:SH3-like domain-containing protein